MVFHFYNLPSAICSEGAAGEAGLLHQSSSKCGTIIPAAVSRKALTTHVLQIQFSTCMITAMVEMVALSEKLQSGHLPHLLPLHHMLLLTNNFNYANLH